MTSKAVVVPARVAEVQTFGARFVAPTKFRLPLSDRSDLIYLFTQIETEAGLKSVDARAGEITKPSLVCERCEKKFTIKARPRWRVVAAGRSGNKRFRPHDARNDDPVERSSGEESAAGRGAAGDSDRVVYSRARFCKPCKEQNIAEARAMHERWRSPPVPPTAAVREVVGPDGRARRVYDGVTPRRVEESKRRGLEECMALVPSHGGSAAGEDLLELESFVYYGGARHARAWATHDALRRLRVAGDLEAIHVLDRLYGRLDPTARYALWAKMPSVDEREVAPLAHLAPSVRAWQRDLGEGVQTPIDRALRSFQAGARKAGETKAAFQQRERDAEHEQRVFLTRVASEVDAIIARCSVAYRFARRGEL